MNKKALIIAGVLVIVVAAIAAFALTNNKDDDMNGMAMTSQESNASNEAQSKASTDSTEAGTSEAAATTSVTIQDFAFSPGTIKVKVGDTVTWTNKDSVQHDVTADNESSDAPSSELLSKGESFSFKFTKAGTYTYHCTPHPYMKGTVVVE